MKLPRFKKKVVAIGLVGGLAIGAGGIAAAFLTATGSGTGTATVASAVSVTMTGHIASLHITQFRHVHLLITNPDSTVALGRVSVTVTRPAGCPTGSFVVTPASTPLGTVPHGTTSLGSGMATHLKEPTIFFRDLPVTQNACTGTLHFSVFTLP